MLPLCLLTRLVQVSCRCGGLVSPLSGGNIIQSLFVVLQLMGIFFQFFLAALQPLYLLPKTAQLLQLIGQVCLLCQCLGNQTVGTVGTAAVF